MNKKINFLNWFLLTFFVFILDFYSKKWMILHLKLGETKPIAPFLNFTYVHNSGIAFSFLSGTEEWRRWFFSCTAIVISAILAVIICKSNDQTKLSKASYAMIIGGAIGNMLDRILYGVVVDFIDFYVGNWHWPVFNLADVSICLGAIMIFTESFLILWIKFLAKRKFRIKQ